MAHARPAALALLVLAGCAATGAARPAPDLSFFDLQARLAARASSLVGHAGEFRVGGARFPPDCTGFVEAVYEAEGIPLRRLMQLAAPEERSGVAAALRAVERYGDVLGRKEWPSPGDIVFWHDTYDRNRNGARDDRLTHVGIVEYVVDGTVVFLHRGGKGVARGAMTPERPGVAAQGATLLNSALREKSPRGKDAPVLAGALLAAYGRIEEDGVPVALRAGGGDPP